MKALSTMKNVILVLSLSSISALVYAEPAKKEAYPQLQASCSLVRNYIGADGQRAMEDLTPSSVKPLPIQFENFSGPDTVPATIVKWSAHTPDGEMKVMAIANAEDWSEFRPDYAFSLFTTVELVNEKVELASSYLPFPDVPKAELQNQIPTFHRDFEFSPGYVNGRASSVYNVVCSITNASK